MKTLGSVSLNLLTNTLAFVSASEAISKTMYTFFKLTSLAETNVRVFVYKLNETEPTIL